MVASAPPRRGAAHRARRGRGASARGRDRFRRRAGAAREGAARGSPPTSPASTPSSPMPTSSARAPEEVVEGEREKREEAEAPPRQDQRGAGAAQGARVPQPCPIATSASTPSLRRYGDIRASQRGVVTRTSRSRHQAALARHEAMRATTAKPPGASMRQFWTAVSLLWLAGAGLRLTILAVPPVIPLIQADLQLSGTEIGILSGLPVILFGIAALPGSLLIARFGALPTLVTGLLIAGVASGLRGALLRCLRALCRHHPDERRCRHHAAGAAAAGAPMAAAARELRHRALHQWSAGRRDAAGHADDPARVPARRQFMALEPRGLGRSARGRSRS